jgi:hypothetical protein
LQHIIIWELGQDLPVNNPYSLLYRAYTANQGLSVVPGDYDADRDADAADYAIWRGIFGQTGFGRAADGNGNQAVDAADYVLWRKTASGPESGAILNNSVPEPSCLLLGASLLFMQCCQRRKSR